MRPGGSVRAVGKGGGNGGRRGALSGRTVHEEGQPVGAAECRHVLTGGGVQRGAAQQCRQLGEQTTTLAVVVTSGNARAQHRQFAPRRASPGAVPPAPT
jgi:hypothetical protein